MKLSKKILSNRKWAEKQPPEWHVWKGMKRRCHESGHMMYEYYGARGIKVCDRWREHGMGFKNFMADMGPRLSPEYHLDRIDPDGDYTKENCRWLHKSENCSASRGCFGNNRWDADDEIESKDETKVADEVPF